jgi:hypothetical protein
MIDGGGGSERSTDAPIERWGTFEVALPGPVTANPFVDVSLVATFRHQNVRLEARGFYDGDGTWRIRCMPGATGEWEWRTASNTRALDQVSGRFRCIAACPGNHGPVRVATDSHFRYADGTQFIQMGTTCYAWTHQEEALEQETLRTLASAPFNKLRMCVFPKHYLYNSNEPRRHPFERTAGGWDFSRFDPAFFQHFERNIADLRDLGIEADIILFHPYDRWGYAAMGAKNDERYLRYLVARLSAFRNVWWSLANEYDLVTSRTMAEWDRLGAVLQESDPYGHPRSIHNCRTFYDHAHPWITHASIQSSELERVTEWRAVYGKPIVVDECCYEGNLHRAWGNITAPEMVHRFWEGTLRGGWVGHGETYLDPKEVLWWSKGGTLRGESPARIAFLKAILLSAPPFLEYTDRFSRHYPALCRGDEFFLVYFGMRQPAEMELALPEGHEYSLEVIDGWQMRITPLPGVFRAGARVPLPGRTHIAIRALAR